MHDFVLREETVADRRRRCKLQTERPSQPGLFDLLSGGDHYSLRHCPITTVNLFFCWLQCQLCHGFPSNPRGTVWHFNFNYFPRVLATIYAHLSWCPRSCRSVSAYFCLSLGSTLANFFTSLRTKYQNSLTPFSTLLRSSSWVGPGPAGVGVGVGVGWGGGVRKNSSQQNITKDTQLTWYLRHEYDLKQWIDDVNFKAALWEYSLEEQGRKRCQEVFRNVWALDYVSLNRLMAQSKVLEYNH